MLPTPRVVVIDDEPKHLEGLAQGLNRYGAACLSLRFTGEPEAIPSCPHVRVIFVDLHLHAGPPGDHARDFSTVGTLIEDMIKPSGPYLIILWTMYPEKANNLHDFLKDRLHNVPKPFAVRALDKANFLDQQDDVKNLDKLAESIDQMITEQPRIGVLINWEERVFGAAADTVSSIMKLAGSATRDVNPDEEVGRLLRQLAVAAVGKKHVAEDRFRAVNEALLPILGDHISNMRSRKSDDILWETALGEFNTEQQLSLDEIARINRSLHIVSPTSDDNGAVRGAVATLPEEYSGGKFEKTFDLDPEETAQRQFQYKSSGKANNSLQWVLIQTQAACDYAQNQPGPLPFHLGLCIPASGYKTRTPPAALWRSPCFEHDSLSIFLHVNARFQVSLPSGKAKQVQPLFRLREQLLNDLIYRIHSYGARPGIVSLR